MQTLFKRIVELFKTNCSTNLIDQNFLHKYDTIMYMYTCIINIYIYPDTENKKPGRAVARWPYSWLGWPSWHADL